jgi:hypothetical protein
MTKLQMLADMITDLANRIADIDQQQSDDDMQAGVIEGKLEAYREVAKGLAKMIIKEA